MDYEILHGDTRHYIQDGEDLAAEMTFSLAGDKMMIIDSTFVDDAYRGQGLGNALLDSVVAQAREEGRKIVPLCPFAKAQFDKNEKYKDISAM